MSPLLMTLTLLVAHGGEDHAAPAGAGTSAAGERRVGVTGTSFELVLRWDAQRDGDLPFDLMLADPDSNRPIADANIALRWSGPGPRKVETAAAATAEPGIYRSLLPDAIAGDWTVTAIIATGASPDRAARTDLLLAELHLGAGAPEAATSSEDAHGTPWLWIALAALALGGVAVMAFVAGRASRRPTGVALGMLAAATLGAQAPPTSAHGGEDHGEPSSAPAAALPGSEVFLAKEVQFLLGVRTERASTRALVDRIRVPGSAVAPPDALAVVHALRGGRLEVTSESPSLAPIGTRVSRGQVLAILVDIPTGSERATLASDRARARAQAESAQARLVALRRDLARKEQITDVIAAQALDDLRAEVRSVEAELRGARAAELALKLDGEVLRLPLLAPIDGIVVGWAAGVALGGNVASDAPIVTLVAPERLQIAARVFEDDAPRIAPHADATTRISDRTVTLAALGAAPVVEAAGRTVEFRYAAPAPSDLALRLGQYLALDLAVGPALELVSVPAAAIIERDGVPTVFVMTGPERFRAVTVAIVRRSGGLAGIRGAVLAGDRVAVEGATFLRHAAPAGAR